MSQPKISVSLFDFFPTLQNGRRVSSLHCCSQYTNCTNCHRQHNSTKQLLVAHPGADNVPARGSTVSILITSAWNMHLLWKWSTASQTHSLAHICASNDTYNVLGVGFYCINPDHICMKNAMTMIMINSTTNTFTLSGTHLRILTLTIIMNIQSASSRNEP